jgi:hypothetical protein
VPAESRPLADDTSADAEQHQIELWRRMTPEQKLALEAFPEVASLEP